MHLFLTSVLPFLAHDHASAVAFLTCRYHNFHASIIPEFLSDEERVQSFLVARQRDQLIIDTAKQYSNLYNLFVQTPLMQFSPSLIVSQNECVESILKPLLATKYFTRSLQRCSLIAGVSLTKQPFQGLAKIQCDAKQDLDCCIVKNQHLEIIVNSFPRLETLTIENSKDLDSTTAIRISFPPPLAAKTLRSLTMLKVDALFATQFVPHLTNLRKLVLRGKGSYEKLDLSLLSSSLPLLTDLSLARYNLNDSESLKNLIYLSSLEFRWCQMPDLSFLTQENALCQLTTLCLESCDGFSASSFASLANAASLRVLNVARSDFDNDCLQYLENMIHLRRLDLSESLILLGSESFKSLMQNLFQLEELNTLSCDIGNQGAIAEALYSNHSRLRVLRLSWGDLNGIGALKHTLEELDLAGNEDLTNEALMNCRDLMKLKILNMDTCRSINDLSPLNACVNLEELNVPHCDGLTDDSFKVFSEEPNSFPNLRVLNLSNCAQLTEKVFEHLSKNNYLTYQLKELAVRGMSEVLSSSSTARNNICQLQGLRRLRGVVSDFMMGASKKEIEVMVELLRWLRNIEELNS